MSPPSETQSTEQYGPSAVGTDRANLPVQIPAEAEAAIRQARRARGGAGGLPQTREEREYQEARERFGRNFERLSPAEQNRLGQAVLAAAQQASDEEPCERIMAMFDVISRQVGDIPMERERST